MCYWLVYLVEVSVGWAGVGRGAMAMAMADLRAIMPQAANHSHDRNAYLRENHGIPMPCCKQRSNLENFSTTQCPILLSSCTRYLRGQDNQSAMSLHVSSQRHWQCPDIHGRW